jgi:hypothetical protein
MTTRTQFPAGTISLNTVCQAYGVSASTSNLLNLNYYDTPGNPTRIAYPFSFLSLRNRFNILPEPRAYTGTVSVTDQAVTGGDGGYLEYKSLTVEFDAGIVNKIKIQNPHGINIYPDGIQQFQWGILRDTSIPYVYYDSINTLFTDNNGGNLNQTNSGDDMFLQALNLNLTPPFSIFVFMNYMKQISSSEFNSASTHMVYDVTYLNSGAFYIGGLAYNTNKSYLVNTRGNIQTNPLNLTTYQYN